MWFVVLIQVITLLSVIWAIVRAAFDYSFFEKDQKSYWFNDSRSSNPILRRFGKLFQNLTMALIYIPCAIIVYIIPVTIAGISYVLTTYKEPILKFIRS